ncbi:hypothetical protein Btru_059119 [Bulinus truncatus]|nr:hypothetical protein Btru_059119 [Bulinus truncatus]
MNCTGKKTVEGLVNEMKKLIAVDCELIAMSDEFNGNGFNNLKFKASKEIDDSKLDVFDVFEAGSLPDGGNFELDVYNTGSNYSPGEAAELYKDCLSLTRPTRNVCIQSGECTFTIQEVFVNQDFGVDIIKHVKIPVSNVSELVADANISEVRKESELVPDANISEVRKESELVPDANISEVRKESELVPDANISEVRKESELVPDANISKVCKESELVPVLNFSTINDICLRIGQIKFDSSKMINNEDIQCGECIITNKTLDEQDLMIETYFPYDSKNTETIKLKDNAVKNPADCKEKERISLDASNVPSVNLTVPSVYCTVPSDFRENERHPQDNNAINAATTATKKMSVKKDGKRNASSKSIPSKAVCNAISKRSSPENHSSSLPSERFALLIIIKVFQSLKFSQLKCCYVSIDPLIEEAYRDRNKCKLDALLCFADYSVGLEVTRIFKNFTASRKGNRVRFFRQKLSQIRYAVPEMNGFLKENNEIEMKHQIFFIWCETAKLRDDYIKVFCDMKKTTTPHWTFFITTHNPLIFPVT